MTDQHIDFVIDTPAGSGSTYRPRNFLFRGELFVTSTVLNGYLMLEISEALDPNCPQYRSSRLTREFLEQVVREEDRERFLSVLKTSKPTVGADELQELVVKLMSALGDDAPLDSSPGSSPGPVQTAAGSEVSSYSIPGSVPIS